jgi:hypothetical protein
MLPAADRQCFIDVGFPLPDLFYVLMYVQVKRRVAAYAMAELLHLVTRKEI